jgi:hypothetical protein
VYAADKLVPSLKAALVYSLSVSVPLLLSTYVQQLSTSA